MKSVFKLKLVLNFQYYIEINLLKLNNRFMNPNTFTLTLERKPTVNISQLRNQDTQNMFQFLPVLRNQSQFSSANSIGYVPNKELNAILDQAKMNKLINSRDGARVYPSGSYNFNIFPSGR